MKNEDKTTPIEKLGYGLKYTLAIIVAILAICALCFIFISITTYFTPPLQPMFDQERLGQLRDFLGGTLNPIFGFATVCLLLWSVFIQRQELSLTREELKKSASALEKQFQLSLDEYNRKQLDEVLLGLEEKLEELTTQRFEAIDITYSNANQTLSSISGVSIVSFIKFSKQNNNNIEELIEKIKDPLYGGKFKNHDKIFTQFLEVTNEIVSVHIELIKVTHLPSIKEKIQKKAKERLYNIRSIFLINEEELKERLNKIDQLMLGSHKGNEKTP